LLTEPQIAINHGTGRMANRMFQLMLATELRRRAGLGRIVGLDLPRWGMVSPPVEVLETPVLILKDHAFDLNSAAYLLRSGVAKTVIVEGWGMRLFYYGPPSQYRGLFAATEEGHRSGEDELLIHVRGDDILDLHHRRYRPMPFSFYEWVIAASGLRPVFMGQIGDDDYSAALRRRFPGARFIERQSVIADFTTLRTARHLVLSVSSFAWLAAWLSESLLTIHLPVYGLFDPSDRRTFLLPLHDARYVFHAIDAPAAPTGDGSDLVAWAEQADAPGPLSREQLAQLAAAALIY
jgi:hypothetical protein